METSTIDRTMLAHLAALLECPGTGLLKQTSDGIEAMRADIPEAAEALERFAGEIAGMPHDRLQEHYARMFELNPQCAPHLGVHLTGGDHVKRARFLAGLQEVYTRAGFRPERELPDHLAVILRFAEAFDDEEWAEMAIWCFSPALASMYRLCEQAQSPYRHVLTAVQCALNPRQVTLEKFDG